MFRLIVVTLAFVGLTGCSGCVKPPPPAVVNTHVITPDHCAVLELRLDSGVMKTICLTSDQLEHVMENQQ